jgi:hypothetical protein
MKERVHSPAIQGSREQRRIAVRRERARARWQRRGQRGQTLVIFALSLTVLLALAGLSVDVSRLYDLYARLQRAAEAGALAGVLYLPNNYGTPLPAPGDGHTAISRASIEVVKNGIGSVIDDTVTSDCPNPVTSVTIAVCQVQVGQLPALRVTVTQTASVALMGGLGVGPSTISATGEASYLPPFALGVSPSAPNYFGDEGECNVGGTITNCNPTGSGAHKQNFVANINGPGDLKEMGDPFVYCEEGPSQGPPAGIADPALPALPYATYNGLGTNHLSYPDATSLVGLTGQHCGQPGPGGSPPGNPDQQPPGYDGPMTDGTSHPGAYNYGIVVPTSGASLWVYNGNYTPYIDGSLNNCHGKQALDTFFKNLSCNGFYSSYGNLTPSGSPVPSWDGKFDDPSLYFNTTFTLYAVQNTYFRNLDEIVTCTGSGFGTAACPPAATGMNQTSNKVEWTFQPFDQMTQDVQLHCFNGYPTYDLSDFSSYGNLGGITPNKGCIASSATPPCLSSSRNGGLGGQSWCNLANNLPAGTYRLAVEATSFDQQSGTSLLSGWGQHGYGIKLCDPTLTIYTPGAAVGCADGGDIAAWNNMDVLFAFPAANANNTLPLADVPSAYAGRSFTIGLFDLCDSVIGNNCWAEIIPPATNDVGTPNPTIPINYPSGVRPGTDPCTAKPAIFGASNGDNIYNGLWLNTTIQLPPNYQGGVWQLNVCTSQGTAQDIVGIKFTLVGSSVFLLPPV